MTKRFTILFMLVLLALSLGLTALAQDKTELRFTCYQDGNECEVYTQLLIAFNLDNPDIEVIIDDPGYNFILESLPVSVEVGEGPDIARITAFNDFAGFYLNLRPLMEDPSVIEDNYNAAVLDAFREEGDEDGLYGFPDALTVTAPFVNATLFEQAGVEIPGEGATWDEWEAALVEVVEQTGVDYAYTTDNRGHRFAGPAMSMGATLFDDEGNFDLAGDEGYAAFAEMLKSWIDAGLSPAETWVGDTYNPGDPFFSNVQTVMYFSGSWQVGNFAENVGDAFDWVVAPNPTGPGGSTGVAGGAGIAAFDSGDEARNAAIARVMEYLAQPEVVAEFSAKTLNIPANAGAVELGVDFDTDDEAVGAALAQFSNEAVKLQDQALALNIHPFAFAYYGSSNTRLSQYFVGELTVDEMLTRLQQDIDDAVANAETG